VSSAAHPRITVQHHVVRDEDPQLPEMQTVVARWMDRMGSDMDKVLGVLPVALDCYFASVRTKETNSGNLLADICRESAKVGVCVRSARCTLGGSKRGEQVWWWLWRGKWAPCCHPGTTFFQADVAIINSGTIRANRVLGPGPYAFQRCLARMWSLPWKMACRSIHGSKGGSRA
jgi:2',3'-cyclic-nucleotide 2'-phosphodiesterase (5'-nucleotidase family)